jgi:glyoxylate reductase
MLRRIAATLPLPEVANKILRKSGVKVVILRGPDGAIPSPAELIDGVREADVLLPRASQPVPREVLAANPDLKGIAVYGVGYNNVDVKYATELGIPVTNTPGVLTETTADLGWALLMAAARKIPQGHLYALSGQWKGPVDKSFMGLDVGPGGSNRRKVLGIIGFGAIGQAIWRRSRGFRMKVVAYDPFLKETIAKTRGVEYKELDDLLKVSDFITLHCNLTKETHHLIGSREFNLMKPTAIIVNASRGAVVDEKALAAALRENRIAAAGLDVYEDEPKITSDLLELKNVVLLPHIGSATQDTRDSMAVVAVRNAVLMVDGKRPMNVVNPDVLNSSEYQRRSAQ